MNERNLELQPASYEIWAKKYQLKDINGNPIDKDINDMNMRVARALADVELPDHREKWYKLFMDALEAGCIPAGRVTSNAGAGIHKPVVSLINCTVSGTIHDSITGIMNKLSESAETLKTGAGIGYEFSTLRPNGSKVTGAGASTSGSLSFMDIYDKMCGTISSAGGRRGAQMGTMDVRHPDVLDFIKAKRQDGRLRQFNLSLLITEEFMYCVKNNLDWEFIFPINRTCAPSVTDDIFTGDKENIFNNIKNALKKDFDKEVKFRFSDFYVADKKDYIEYNNELLCMVYNTIPAKELWDIIMTSTYEYSEPGFILIDKVNDLNNLWWCESIRATNPCVTADTRLYTDHGMVTVGELYEKQLDIKVTVDNRTLFTDDTLGTSVRHAIPVFMSSPEADVYKVTTEAGYEIKATEWHDFYTQRGKIKLKDLVVNEDFLYIQSGEGQFGIEGSKELGTIIGLITGDGHFSSKKPDKEKHAHIGLWDKDKELADYVKDCADFLIETYADIKNIKNYNLPNFVSVESRNMITYSSVNLTRMLEYYGYNADNKLRVPECVWKGTKDCVKGYLSALFQVDGSVMVSPGGCDIRLNSSCIDLLKDVQILLGNFGIYSKIYLRRDEQYKMMPDGKGGQKEYFCKKNYDLIIGGSSRDKFMEKIGFLSMKKNKKYYDWAEGKTLERVCKFESKIVSIEYVGKEAVYDTTQKDKNSVIFGGIVTGQCGEQPLPPYGACLLGSINLTKFVTNPFTEKAEFNLESFKKYVRIFTRMLDNVVELNNLPLEQQRNEITRKRRHGMGFLGFGSTCAMLRLKYGSSESIELSDLISKTMALVSFEEGVELAKEKGSAPIMDEEFIITEEMVDRRPEILESYSIGDVVTGNILLTYSKYMQKLFELNKDLKYSIIEHGVRFSHATSIAPTGTISFSLANNASNGIEPSFEHWYTRNVIVEGKPTKTAMDVFSYELLLYRHLVDPEAGVNGNKLPDYFISSTDITAKEHIDIQAACQNWIDSSISKTANVPTEYNYEDFKEIYMYGYEKGCKGVTTFRFNPVVFQGVLVKKDDLDNTRYVFVLEDGSEVSCSGSDMIEYNGDVSTAANLYDALKEGYYGMF